MIFDTLKRRVRRRLRWLRRYEGIYRSALAAACRPVAQLGYGSDVFGPPRGWVKTTTEWIARQPAGSANELITVFGEERIARRPPHCPDAALAERYRPFLERTVPPFTVAVLRDARVWGHYGGVVITSTDEVLEDLSWDYWDIARNDVFTRLRLPAVRHVHGIVANVCTPEARSNYWHWTLDLMPRLRVLEAAGFTPKTVDAYLVNGGASWQRELLLQAGIAPEQIICVTAHDHIHADTLVVPSRKRCYYDVLPWMIDYFGGLHRGMVPAGSPRKLWISRKPGTRRRAVNEAEAFEAVRGFGFELVDPGEMPVPAQQALFAGATHVVGASGAGFANLVYCRPGTKVMEIAPPPGSEQFQWSIAEAASLAFSCIPATPVATAKPKLPIDRDVEVDIPGLVAAVHANKFAD